MKSSWRSPDGGSSVTPNTKIEPSEAAFCAWWSTASTPIRSFHTVSEEEFCEVGLPHYGVLGSSARKRERLRHAGSVRNLGAWGLVGPLSPSAMVAVSSTPQPLSPLSCLTVQQDVESPIVRDDRVQTRAAVDHVFHPVGRSDGVVPIAAEDLLPSSRKVHHTSEPTSVNAVGQRA